jgi:hypothetical protein
MGSARSELLPPVLRIHDPVALVIINDPIDGRVVPRDPGVEQSDFRYRQPRRPCPSPQLRLVGKIAEPPHLVCEYFLLFCAQWDIGA